MICLSHTHARTHAHTHARRQAGTHAHTNTHTRTQARTHIHTHTHTHARTHTHTTHAPTRTHIHTHAHTHKSCGGGGGGAGRIILRCPKLRTMISTVHAGVLQHCPGVQGGRTACVTASSWTVTSVAECRTRTIEHARTCHTFTTRRNSS